MRTRGIAEPAIEAYLDDVATRLIGPHSTRAAILEELRDGLQTAAEAYRTRGTTPDGAVAAALAEFGGASAVADAFAGELANAQARRVSLAYLLTGPVVGISWLLLLAPANRSRQGPGTLWSSIPALPLILLGVVASLLVLAGTGRLSRWIRLTPRHLLDVTTLLGLACIAGDLIVLAVLAQLAAATLDQPVIVTATAATGSLARLVCSIATVRSCRHTRSALAS